jgi:endonuclease YncB( thermonuclease family)
MAGMADIHHLSPWRGERRARRSYRQHRRLRWSSPFIPLAIVVSALAAGWFASPEAGPGARAFVGSPNTARFEVVDGDTIRVDGTLTRLVGFNTPETFEPLCAEERALGLRAKARLRALLGSGFAVFTPAACACPPGTEGTPDCNYGRACGDLRIDGVAVGSRLIAEGLAIAYHCLPTGCPRAPRPWCGGQITQLRQ